MFCLRNLPVDVKPVFAEKMLEHSHSKWHTRLNSVIGFMNLTGQNMAVDFIEKIKLHDEYRNEKFEEIHPEVWKLLNGSFSS